MDERSAGLAKRLTPRLIFGLAVMAAGLLLTLDNLGVFDAGQLLRLWPVVLIAVGLVKLRTHEAGERGGAFVWLGLGVLLLLNSLDLLQLRKLWPLVLLLLGASMVRRALAGAEEKKDSRVKIEIEARGPRTTETTSDSFLNSFAVMGGVTRGTNSQDFRGGDLAAIMGGCEIDLRKASIQAEEAVVECFALWGGVEIYVPEDWEVVNRGFAIMGGFEDSTKRPAEPKGRLVLKGLALMGGVEVSN